MVGLKKNQTHKKPDQNSQNNPPPTPTPPPKGKE